MGALTIPWEMAEPTEKAPEKTPEPEDAAARKAPRLTAADLTRDAMARFDQPGFIVAAALSGVDPDKRMSVAEASKLVTAFLNHEVEVETEA